MRGIQQPAASQFFKRAWDYRIARSIPGSGPGRAMTHDNALRYAVKSFQSEQLLRIAGENHPALLLVEAGRHLYGENGTGIWAWLAAFSGPRSETRSRAHQNSNGRVKRSATVVVSPQLPEDFRSDEAIQPVEVLDGLRVVFNRPAQVLSVRVRPLMRAGGLPDGQRPSEYRQGLQCMPR